MQDETKPTSQPVELIDSFLENAKIKLYNLKEFEFVTVVMGNETCDLDSVCCSIAYGVYFYDHYIRNSLDCVSIALLDIKSDEMKCKTEVIYWMKKLKVQVSNFVFRNQINLFELHALKKLRLVLVDHHVLSPRYNGLQAAVVEVIDHRPLQAGTLWPGIDFIIEIAGSCATLMAKKLLKMRKQMFTLQFALLLYGPIILDTAGCSRNSGRTTEFDLKMADILETMYDDLHKGDVLKELSDARANVHNLPTKFLLRKDLKFAGSIPICGIPISITRLLDRTDLEKCLRAFCLQVNCQLMVIMGQEILGDTFNRTLAIYATEKALEGAAKLVDFLEAAADPDLQLNVLVEESNQITHFTAFSQGNTHASRKQVLPLILEAISVLPELNKTRVTCLC